MAKASKNMTLIPDEIILSKIYVIRGEKIMLDRDLAELYGVTTANLNKAVKRNIQRFPADFMFQLTKKEFDSLIFHSGTSKGRGGTRKLPHAFTEQGVGMLSAVLNTQRAIKVHIQIIRLFTKMREYFITHKDVLFQLQKMEKNVLQNEEDIQVLFDLMKQLLIQEEKPRKKIGYKIKK